MVRVICNLVLKGIQASGPKGVIRIKMTRSVKNLIIEVCDEGSGLPEGKIESLFEPFVTHRMKGTGLGLLVSRQIVEAHGGKHHRRKSRCRWGLLSCLIASFPTPLFVTGIAHRGD